MTQKRRSCGAALVLILFTLAGSGSAAGSSDGRSLVGVWEAARVYGPEISETLTLWRHRETREWRAEIADVRVSFGADAGRLHFRLPGDRGAFRGTFSAAQGRVDGHWISPPSSTLNYPVATPVVFDVSEEPSGRWSVWRGAVRPQKNHVTLFLRVLDDRAEGGGLRAFVRNPERNLGIFMGVQSLRRDGDQVELLLRDGQRLRGDLELGESGDRMSFHLGWLGATFDFRRAPRTSAFYPARDDQPYEYRAPLPKGDGWRTADARDVGLDADALASAVESLRRQTAESVTDPYVHALLVSRRGRLVLEEYFHGFGAETPHDTRSAGKSLASMIAGLSYDRGDLVGGEGLTPASRLVDAYGDAAAEPDASGDDLPAKGQREQWRRQMTLGHLLSMSSGLECDDDDGDSVGNEGRVQDQQEQDSWRAYTLAVPTEREPGSKALYCSAGIDLALGMVHEASGTWLPELFARGLARPLRIEEYHFNLAPSWEGYMGGGIYLRPRDQLKLGQVILDEGLWNDTRVLSAEWVELSTRPRAGIHESGDYGLGWWSTDLVHPLTQETHRAIYASGNGGQLTIVVPSLEMVVQFSAGNYNNYGTWGRSLHEFVPARLMTAVVPSPEGGASSRRGR